MEKSNELTLYSYVSGTFECFLEILLTLFPLIQTPRYLEIADQITGWKLLEVRVTSAMWDDWNVWLLETPSIMKSAELKG